LLSERDRKQPDEGAKMAVAWEPRCFSGKVALRLSAGFEPFTPLSLTHIFKILSIHIFTY
jgi:hypothetical protein